MGIHLNHPRDTDVYKPGHPTHSAEASGNQMTAVATQEGLTSFLIIDDQQAGPKRSRTFTLMQMKHLNPPLLDSATGEESQHNMSGLSSF